MENAAAAMTTIAGNRVTRLLLLNQIIASPKEVASEASGRNLMQNVPSKLSCTTTRVRTSVQRESPMDTLGGALRTNRRAPESLAPEDFDRFNHKTGHRTCTLILEIARQIEFETQICS